MRRLLACLVCLVLLIAGSVVADAEEVIDVHKDRVLFDYGFKGRWIEGDFPLPGDEYEGDFWPGYQVMSRDDGGETTFVIEGPESIGQAPLEYLFGD